MAEPAGASMRIRELEGIGTPAYVYDLEAVRRAHDQLCASLPQPSLLYYSLKANPHPALVRTLARAGCRAEICSSGELTAALEAGVPPAEMLYTGPAKRDEEVEEAVKVGVGWFSADSPAGLQQIERIASAAGQQARCLLRINDHQPAPGQGLTMTGVTSQFGADAEWVEAAPQRFRTRQGKAPAGLHLYMGSNLETEDALLDQFTRAIATARRLAEVFGTSWELLDIGGGFGAPYARPGPLPQFPTLAGRLTAVLDGAFPQWRQGSPQIAFESGRHLVGSCGHLLARVLDVKRSHGRPVVVLESGINHLGGMSGMRRLPQLIPHLNVAEVREGPGLAQAVIAGPLCTPLDTWARSADLPDVRAGDVVSVPNVGAYGLTASLLAFLGHQAPSEVVIDAGQVVGHSRLALVRHPAPTTVTGTGAPVL